VRVIRAATAQNRLKTAPRRRKKRDLAVQRYVSIRVPSGIKVFANMTGFCSKDVAVNL